MSTIKQGDIFWFDFGDPVDERQAVERPALVIQTDYLNDIEPYGLTIILPITTKGKSNHIRLAPSQTNGLPEISYVKFEQVYSVPKRLLKNKLGFVDPNDLAQVKNRLRALFNL